ncbi:MAG: RHS repeat-associated core domain-containing protein, partial [Planctomycetes bacterium]|nr:RHS repeat-associated core domain-containing protein [Planctomycetota bacterium]
RFVFTGRELDPETQIYFYRARYYQQGLGRFVSRDVGFYDYLATASLYLYGTSNPTAGVDPTGFVWEIQRDWLKPQAIARGEHDTVENLAKKIGLNGREYRAWLEPADGKGLPASEKDDVGSCRLFKIPNEIIAFWGGELGGVGKALVGWQQQISTLQGRGFYTIPVQGWTSARLSQEIRDDSRRKWLHGFFFWGHGNCVSILLDSSKKNDNTGNWDYYFAQFFADTAYRLGFGVMFCCEGKSARFVFSDNAIFWGMSGTLVPLPPFFPPPVGNIIKPGEQGTRR